MMTNHCVEAARKERIYDEARELYKELSGLEKIPTDVDKMIKQEVIEGGSLEDIVENTMEKFYR